MTLGARLHGSSWKCWKVASPIKESAVDTWSVTGSFFQRDPAVGTVNMQPYIAQNSHGAHHHWHPGAGQGRASQPGTIPRPSQAAAKLGIAPRPGIGHLPGDGAGPRPGQDMDPHVGVVRHGHGYLALLRHSWGRDTAPRGWNGVLGWGQSVGVPSWGQARPASAHRPLQ